MKVETQEEISFTNSYCALHLNKKEGAVALDFRSQELVIYLNTSLYQNFAWLLISASECVELMSYVDWKLNPKSTNKNSLIEIHGPNHAVCLACSPHHERVQLNYEIGLSIDLKFTDFKGLISLIKEAQDDFEWRRNLLQWTIKKDINNHHTKDRKSL